MDIGNLKEFMKLLRYGVSENAEEVVIDDTEDGPVLVCTAKSPFIEDSVLEYEISLTPDDNGTIFTEISIALFTGIDNAAFDGLDRLFNMFNDLFSFRPGSYKLIDESGTVMFTQGFLLNETVPEKTAISMIGKTMKVMEDIVYTTGGYILKNLSGASPEDIMKELCKAEG